MQFVTFRLNDSLPQSKIAEIAELRKRFEMENPRPWSDETMRRYHNLTGPMEERLLDNGYGSCMLGDVRIRQVVSECIKDNHGQLCRICAFVIMPNHVHLLCVVHHDAALSEIIKKIKGNSSRRINALRNCTGSIWMREYFDRLVRSEADFNRYLNYIRENPARLVPGQYELYVNPAIERCV